MFTEKQRNPFPELNLPLIRQYVETLAAEYPGSLRRVTLNRFSDREHKYLLAFELSSNKKSRIALLNSMALELTGYEKHLPAFYLDRKACNERDWLFLPVYKRDPDYSEMTIEGGGLVLFDSQARGGVFNTPPHTTSGFYRKGDFWRIVYNGKETTIKDTDGVYYLGLLLSSPNREISARELYASRKGGLVDEDEAKYAHGQLELNKFTSDLPALNRKAYRELVSKVYEAYQEWQVAKQQKNKDSAVQWKKKFEDYKRSCRLYGISVSVKCNGELGFRKTAALDRRTDAVRKAIDRARNNILSGIQDKNRGSEIASHLMAVKRSGRHYIYTPPKNDPIDWIFAP